MSKTILSYFTKVSHSGDKNKAPVTATKKRPVVISSDEDDVIPNTPNPTKKKKTKLESTIKTKTRRISSDSEQDLPKAKRNKKQHDEQENLIPVNVSDVFSKEPARNLMDEELDLFSEESFKETLVQLDTEDITKPPKRHDSEPSSTSFSTPRSNNTPKSNRKQKAASNLDDSVVDTDEERYEKRRHSAALYQKYLNRSGPSNPGSKEIPKGSPNCLKGLSFVVTGVLESLERSEIEQVIVDLGGKTVKQVSKKVTHVIFGTDAGPAKLEKAKSFGIKLVTEDEFLDLIRSKSGTTLHSSKTSDLATIKTQSPNKVLSKEIGSITKKENIKTTNKSPGEKTKSPKDQKPKIEQTIQNSPPKGKKRTFGDNAEERERYTKKSPKDGRKSSNEIKQEVTKPVGTSKREIEVTPQDTESPFFAKTTNKDTKISIDINEKNKISSTVKSMRESKVSAQTSIRKPQSPLSKAKPTIQSSTDHLAWVDKYKPQTVESIVGQQGDRSTAKKLRHWLNNWYKNRRPNAKVPKPSPWAKSDDGAYFKAALLSGSPGVGKTTTAVLVSKALGFDTVEFNASDTRNKKLLHEDVGHLLSNKSLAGYFSDGAAPTNKHVLIMDEVDGMAGNEDRGGMQELISLIKNSSVPIICMCNDRNHQKIRSLLNYCFDLRFMTPSVGQIRNAMMSICLKEGLNIEAPALDEIIIGTGNDLRQTLNHLSLWAVGNRSLTPKEANTKVESVKKDIKLGPWDVIRKVFSDEEHKNMSFYDKSDLFFHDYSLGPLFVQENYLQVKPNCVKSELLNRVVEAAESLSMGDLVDTRIRSSGAWSLLPLQAICSSVQPGASMAGKIGRINFPGWLGKNSKRNKFQRLLSDLHVHMRLCISGSRQAINLDYLTYIRDSVLRPLMAQDTETAVNSMHNYHLLREDLDSLVELSLWPHVKNPMDLINGKVKAAFTRSYNKQCNMSHSVASMITKKRVVTTGDDDLYGEENEDVVQESEGDDDDIGKDSMITIKKSSSSAKGKGKSSTASSSSKKSEAKKSSTAKPRIKKPLKK